MLIVVKQKNYFGFIWFGLLKDTYEIASSCQLRKIICFLENLNCTSLQNVNEKINETEFLQFRQLFVPNLLSTELFKSQISSKNICQALFTAQEM